MNDKQALPEQARIITFQDINVDDPGTQQEIQRLRNQYANLGLEFIINDLLDVKERLNECIRIIYIFCKFYQIDEITCEKIINTFYTDYVQEDFPFLRDNFESSINALLELNIDRAGNPILFDDKGHADNISQILSEYIYDFDKNLREFLNNEIKEIQYKNQERNIKIPEWPYNEDTIQWMPEAFNDWTFPDMREMTNLKALYITNGDDFKSFDVNHIPASVETLELDRIPVLQNKHFGKPYEQQIF